jgi:putative acetyltransferase
MAERFGHQRGYVGKQRNTVTVNGEWLANTTMQKTLTDGPPSGVPT